MNKKLLLMLSIFLPTLSLVGCSDKNTIDGNDNLAPDTDTTVPDDTTKPDTETDKPGDTTKPDTGETTDPDTGDSEIVEETDDEKFAYLSKIGLDLIKKNVSSTWKAKEFGSTNIYPLNAEGKVPENANPLMNLGKFNGFSLKSYNKDKNEFYKYDTSDYDETKDLNSQESYVAEYYFHTIIIFCVMDILKKNAKLLLQIFRMKKIC